MQIYFHFYYLSKKLKSCIVFRVYMCKAYVCIIFLSNSIACVLHYNIVYYTI